MEVVCQSVTRHSTNYVGPLSTMTLPHKLDIYVNMWSGRRPALKYLFKGFSSYNYGLTNIANSGQSQMVFMSNIFGVISITDI